jgi:hypothetical protein
MGRPSTSFGHVQPFGVRKTIIGHGWRGWPLFAFVCASFVRKVFLNIAYACVGAIESCGEKLVDDFGIVAFNEFWRVAEALVERDELLVARASCDRGAGYFVAIQMQDRQHGSVARRIQELDSLPASFERAGLGFAVADDAGQASRPGLSKAAP